MNKFNEIAKYLLNEFKERTAEDIINEARIEGRIAIFEGIECVVFGKHRVSIVVIEDIYCNPAHWSKITKAIE